MDYALKNPFKMISVLFLVVFIGVFVLFKKSAIENAKEEVRSDVLNWNYEISENFHRDGRSNVATKIADELKQRPISNLSFFYGETTMVSWPEHIVSEKDECHRINLPLTLPGGIQVGRFESCISESKVFLSTLGSPLLLTLFAIFGLLVLIAGIYPRFGYKRSQEEIVDKLTEWKESPGDMNNIKSSDKLTQKVIELVASGVRSQLELVTVKSELLAEERFSKELERAAHDIESPVNRLVRRLKATEGLEKEHYLGFQRNLQKLLDLSMDLRKRKLRLNRCDDHEISQCLVEALEEKALEAPNIKINVSIDKDLRALCGKKDLERVVSNVVNNAIDACKDTGVINIEAKRDGNHCVKIVVSDDGVGIPDTEQHKVFMERYTYGKKNGTGLGLFYAKKKLEEWGGKIYLSSVHGEGTTVTMELCSENQMIERKIG